MAQRAPLWACCCILFAASFLVDIASAARPTLKAMRDEAKGFDYFMFVRQWPGSYCGTHACPRLEDAGPFHFTIHGLWPNYNDGTWPQFCDTSYKFDEDEVSDLEEALDLEWPSFMGENADFWDHEWSKHGTCALDLFPREHRFFKTVLKLHWKYDIAAALRAANILPSTSNTYKVSELADAVEDMYGARPVIHCYNKQLSEVWMCVDKDLKPFTCDSHQKDTCTEVSIPPLPKRNKTTASAASAFGRKAARAALVKAALLAEDAAAGGQDDFDALNRQLAAARAAAAAAVSDGVVDLVDRSQEAEPERVQTPDQLAEQRELDSLFGALTASRQAAADMLLPLLTAGGTSEAGSGSDVAVNTQEPEPELQVDPVVAAPGDVVALGAEALAEAEAEVEADGGVAADDSVFAFLAGAHKLLRGAVAAAAESLAAGAAASEQQQQRLAAVQQLAAAVAAAGAEERVSNAGESYATTGAAGAAVQAEAEAAQEVSAEAQAAAEAEAAELDVVSGGEEEEDEYLAGNMYVDWLPMAAATHAAAAAASSSAEAVVTATLSAAASIVSALANQEVEQQRELATGAAAAGAIAGAGAEVAVGEGNQWDAWQREQEAHATELVQLAAARQAMVAAQHAQQLQADVLSGVLSALASRVGSLMQHLQQVTAASEGAAAVAAADDEYETEGTFAKDSSMQAPREIDGLGLGGFVWTSRLRAEAHAAAAAAAAAMQEAEAEAAAAANGAAAAAQQQQQRSAANAAAVHGHSAGGAANRVSVAADGDGHLTWVVQHVVVLRGGADAGGEGAGRRGGALDWVAMGQMLCATVLAVSLALLALLALARAVQTEQDEPAAVQQERQLAAAAAGCPVSWLFRGRRQRAAAAGAGSELAAPLLLAEEAGKAVEAASEEEGRVRSCSESLLRAGIIVVLPVEGSSGQQQPQQQQQQQHPYAATH